MKRILITGGAGFIGTHVVRFFVKKYPNYKIMNLDALTYAGNLSNLKDIENTSNYSFQKADITQLEELKLIFDKFQPTDIIHLAAESHVDRSITHPMAFAQTNILGTLNLLELARQLWKEKIESNTFYQISTDEVYGSLPLNSSLLFSEHTTYDPHSPYAASKASADHFVRAYSETYGLPIKISNCSNNYGPYQFPEKLIPLTILNIINNKPIPVYGNGLNVRDWLWVGDHARAIDIVFHQGKNGQTFNIGGSNEIANIDIVKMLCKITDKKLGRVLGASEKLITFIEDRKGHDLRYAIDASKIKSELGWEPSLTLEVGLEKTVEWYLANEEWLEKITTGTYKDYYHQQYKTLNPKI